MGRKCFWSRISFKNYFHAIFRNTNEVNRKVKPNLSLQKLPVKYNLMTLAQFKDRGQNGKWEAWGKEIVHWLLTNACENKDKVGPHPFYVSIPKVVNWLIAKTSHLNIYAPRREDIKQKLSSEECMAELTKGKILNSRVLMTAQL